MPIPSGFDTILRTQYGNYLTPQKVPTCHGGFAILDTEKSYKEYLPILRKKAKNRIIQHRLKKIKSLFRLK